MALQQGQPLLKEVETAILGKKVLCFVKFYLADKNYTVVQLYTEEGTSTSAAIEIQSQDESVLPMVEQPTKGKTEFFSPNTKAVLEEIADAVEMKDGSSSQPPHSKRTLMFGTIPTPIPETSSEKSLHQVLVHIRLMKFKVQPKRSRIKTGTRKRKRQFRSCCIFMD